MIDPDDYYEYHESKEELRETHAEHYPIECPMGKRLDCEFFRYNTIKGYDEDDCEWWCEHPSLEDNEDPDVCPLEKEDKE